jgi:hypothetical protein
MVASATEVSSRVIISVSFPVKLLKRLTVCLLPRPWAAKPPEVPSDAESPAIRISTLFSSHCRRRSEAMIVTLRNASTAHGRAILLISFGASDFGRKL